MRYVDNQSKGGKSLQSAYGGAGLGFSGSVRVFRVSAGAGFLVALTGYIMPMPGLA